MKDRSSVLLKPSEDGDANIIYRSDAEHGTRPSLRTDSTPVVLVIGINQDPAKK